MIARRAALGLCAALVVGGLSAPIHADGIEQPLPRPGWVPASFKPLPVVAKAARSASAKASGLTDTKANAWGDPSAGCFALIQSLRVPIETADIAALTQAARRALSGSTGKDATATEPQSAEHSWSFATKGVRGWTWLGAAESDTGFLRVESRSCFFNRRSPDHCEALCKRAIDSFESR